MAKTKFKLGQTLETAEQFGKIKKIVIAEEGVTYVLTDDGEVAEKDVTAVYRAVVPRVAKPRAMKAGKKSKSEARAAA